MERDNHAILIIVSLVTLGVFTYLFHQSEMKAIRDLRWQIEYENKENTCRVIEQIVRTTADLPTKLQYMESDLHEECREKSMEELFEEL